MGRHSQVGIHVREAEPLPPAVLPLAPFGVGKWMRRHPFRGGRTSTPGCLAVSSVWSMCSGWGGVRMWVSMCEWPNPYPQACHACKLLAMEHG